MRRGMSENGRHGEKVRSDREVFTVEQAAEYLQVHKVTVYKYIRTGILPAAKLGKVYRIHRRDLDALLAAARTR